MKANTTNIITKANTNNITKANTNKVNTAGNTQTKTIIIQKQPRQMTKEEKKEIDAAICSDYIKSIERMQELIDYYKAFKTYSNEKLDEFELEGKKKAHDLKFVHRHLQIYFEVYGALTDEFKYRVLYDATNPQKHFNRSYHRDVKTNYEYLNWYFLNKKIDLSIVSEYRR
jgi:hypothetical protein